MLSVAIGQHKIVVPIAVDISNLDIDGRIGLCAERECLWKIGCAIVEANLIGASSARDQDIGISILIDVGKRQTSNRRDFSEGPVKTKARLTVIEKNLAGCHIIPGHNIQITIPIEVGEFTGVSGGAVNSEGSHHVKTCSPLIQKGVILLGPMSTVGHHNVQITVRIKITNP